MMARNQTKMDAKLKELEASYPEVQHSSIKVDFSELTSITEYRNLITENLVGKDIAFVALNAGLARMGSVHKIKDRALEEVMRVNGLQVVYAAKVFLEVMMKREQKSAMVFVSSVAGELVWSGAASYSATKAFVTNLGKSTYYEVKDKVDLMVWTPGMIATNFAANISNDAAKQKKMMQGGISCERAVSAMLKDVGHTSCSDGAIEHAMTNTCAVALMCACCCAKSGVKRSDKILKEENPE
jgi:short-subunit dehydrogenase